MRLRPLVSGTVVLGFLLGPLLAVAPARAAEVLARLGSKELTVDEMRAYLETLPKAEREVLAKDPALLTTVVRTYLAQRVLLAEAQAKKFDQQPAIQAQLARARDQALSDLYLESVARPPDSYPSEDDVQATYKGNRQLFVVPRRFHLAQVVVAVTAGADKAADKAADDRGRRKAAELSRKLRSKGADFAAAARAEGGESAARGGDLGWLAEAQLPPGILEAASTLAKDGVSEPVRLPDGWHVLKLLEVQAATVRPLEEVRDAVIARMRQEKARELKQQYMSKLLGASEPAINELALPEVLEGNP
jgi:parvulin-like peptidyl-prolyl isomerase